MILSSMSIAESHKNMRLTPMEIERLVEELIKRLEIKMRKQEAEVKNGTE